MNYEDLSARIDQFFDSVEPNEVVTMFEEMGYEFEEKSAYKPGNILVKLSEPYESGRLFDYRRQLKYFDAKQLALEPGACAPSFAIVEEEAVKLGKACNFKQTDTQFNYAMAA